jgi:hypothetical protein
LIATAGDQLRDRLAGVIPTRARSISAPPDQRNVEA